MSTSLRCWIAGSALAFSAFVLTSGSTAEDLGASAGLVLLAVFLNAWIIAVGEHAGESRGGLRVRRFPLGGRLLRAYPGLQGQMMLFILIAGAITGSWSVAGWALLVLAVLSLEVVRRAAWFVVPVAIVVHALLNMAEFHSLGDLVGTARGWMTGGFLVGLQVLIVCGPLLRVDAGGHLGAVGRALAMIASLPGYLGAFWLASRPPLAGQLSSLQALLLVLLVGGVVQALLLAAMSWSSRIKSRDADDLSPASPRGVGMALLPMLLPVLAPLLPLFVVGVDGPPAAWAGLGALLLIVPAVPAAAWIASAIDRVDGRQAWAGMSLAACALLVWVAFCPTLLGKLYSATGPAARLHVSYPVGEAQVLAKTVASGGAPDSATLDDPDGGTLGGAGHAAGHAAAEGAGRFGRAATAPGTELLLFDLPASPLARALGVLLVAASWLSVRWMRHARPLQRPANWLEFGLLAGAAGGAAWWLLPRHGLPAAVLGMAGACVLLLAIDLCHSEIVPAAPPEAPPDSDEDDFPRFEIDIVDVSPDRGEAEVIT